MSIQNNELMTTTGNRFILPQAVETTFTAEELAEDMDGIQLNFRQVKVPAGGTLQYEIPTEDPDVPDYDRFLEGIILFHHPSNAYWPDVEDGGDGENVPPQCQALDGKFGHGSPGGLCASCGYNRFGTRGKGKACKNMHMVYLLRSGEFMPLQITLPPTSIKPFNEFVSRAFLLHRRGICSALVQLGLKKMNNGKDDYSVTTFKLLRYLFSLSSSSGGSVCHAEGFLPHMNSFLIRSNSASTKWNQTLPNRNTAARSSRNAPISPKGIFYLTLLRIGS